MSNSYYNELWLVTEKDMEKLLQLDRMVQTATSPKSADVALNTILPIYLKYRDLVNRLIICHDQMIQPQKRELIKQVLDCVIGRMLEYDREIVQLESNDNQWPDDFLIKMKMTPQEMAFPVPMSYAADRKIFLEQRRTYIEDLINKATTTTTIVNDKKNSANIERMEQAPSSSTLDLAASESKTKLKRRRKTLEASKMQVRIELPEEKIARESREAAKKAFQDSISLIQKHERARIARRIGAQAEREYKYNKKLASGQLEPTKVSRKIKKKAATIIQKHWRGYVTRKERKQQINRVEELLDMTIPSWEDKSVFQRDLDNCQRRISLQPEAVSALEEITNKERARVFKIHGPGLMEDITDEIREWFLIWHNKLGYFDAYPVAEAGGSILVATGQTFTPEEFLVDQWEKAAKKSEKKKDSGSKDDDAKAKKKSTKAADGTHQGDGWTMPEESKALQGLVLAEDEFVRNWSLRDEPENQNQSQEYLDLIDEKLCYELQLEMREVVDELMRLELAKLNEALKKDHAGDKEKFVIPTMVKDKKKKKKPKKKRGKKDPLGDASTEKMFNELVLAKIIHNYPEKHLDDWLGDLSYQNYEARLQFRDYQHRLGEVKQNVMKYCVLPLGSRQVHAMAPLIKSVCICGMPRYGKSFLANAICTEVGALLFDLTPSVLVGQYEGKKNQQKLMNMIGKLAREYAPSVVFIDGGDKPWWKKIPMNERYTQPKRFAKLLPKFVKSIKPGDQVLFLTLASEPYQAKKGFLKIHQKFIIIPITDYNTIYMFYKNLLMKYHGIDRNLDVSCLAKVSVGYPLEFIREVVEKVMNVSRKIKLRFQPLDPREILTELLTYDGPALKTVEQFKKFESKTPLGKNRAKMLNALKDALDNPADVKKKKAKPK